MRTQIILNSIACALIALSMIVRNCERAEEREKASALREANERLEAEVALREEKLAALSGTKGERLEPGDGDSRPVDEAERVHGHGNAAGVGDDENGGRVAEGLASVDDLRDGAGPVRIGCETTNLVVSATAQDVANSTTRKHLSTTDTAIMVATNRKEVKWNRTTDHRPSLSGLPCSQTDRSTWLLAVTPRRDEENQKGEGDECD